MCSLRENHFIFTTIMNSTIQTLNKTSFNTTVGKGAVREGDKILCLRVYKYLMGLSYLIEPSDDLRAVLTRDMFVKSNPKAFFLVMHYLFNALDPMEFKQRFYWPLDKNTENTFRTKTVQYLNDLNNKYDLKLGTVQTFIVVMPGGSKFLYVLLKLLRLVMRDVIRKKQRVGNIHEIKLVEKFKNFTKPYMNEMSARSKLWQEKTTKLVKKYTANANILDNHTISLRNILQAIIDPQAPNIKFNLYSINSNQRDVTNILNYHFMALEEQTALYEQYKTILYKFKTNVYKKLSTNNTSMVEFDMTQFQKSTVILAKYNNASALDSSNDKLIKSKLSNMLVQQKSVINLIDLYDIIIFYADQIKLRFFNHSSVNVKNLQINTNVLEQYLTQLNNNSIELSKLKCSINKYKEPIEHGCIANTKQNATSNTNRAAFKVNIMVTPRIKWTNLNDVALTQSHTARQNQDNTIGPNNNNNTILLSALLSSKKLNRSASKRTRFSFLSDNLNLDSSFDLQDTMTTKPSSRSIKVNLNTDKFQSPLVLESRREVPVLLSTDKIYKSILKNRNQSDAIENRGDVSISPTGKYSSFLKIESDDVKDPLLFKRTETSTIGETTQNRPGSSSPLTGIFGYSSTNSSNATQISLGGNDSNESGFEVLQTSDDVETSSKRIDQLRNDSFIRGIKYPYRLIDTIDLTVSNEKMKPCSSSNEDWADQKGRNQTNIHEFLLTDINLLDTSDSCLDDVTLLN